MDIDHEIGCMMGLVLGDALCAPYEGGIAARGLWSLLGKTRGGKHRWTDDTQMSIDIMNSLIAKGRLDQNHLAHTFSQSYRWRRGYGPGAAKILRKIRNGCHWAAVNRSVYKDGSYGNGAAMRVPPLVLFYRHRRHLLPDAITKSSVITHTHPLALEGAQIIGSAVLAALDEHDTEAVLEAAGSAANATQFIEKISTVKDLLRSHPIPPPKQVASSLGNGISALGSCITAIYIALTFTKKTFQEMIHFVQGVGGDADTIGAMAGAIWGSYCGLGKVPNELIESVEETDSIIELTRALCRKAPD